MCIQVRLRKFIGQMWVAYNPHFICVAFLIQDVVLDVVGNITSPYSMEDMALPNSRN